MNNEHVTPKLSRRSVPFFLPTVSLYTHKKSNNITLRNESEIKREREKIKDNKTTPTCCDLLFASRQ